MEQIYAHLLMLRLGLQVLSRGTAQHALRGSWEAPLVGPA